MGSNQALTVSLSTAADAPGWCYQRRGRLAQIGIGHSLYRGFNWFFDNVVCVYVVYNLGMVVGGAIMTTGSLLQCAGTLIVYERMGIDWVGAGMLNEIAQKRRHTLIERILLWALRRNAVFIFVVLCMFTDPFITTAYFRAGAFDGLRKRDWKIFLASVLVSNLYWIMAADLIGHAIAAVWAYTNYWG